MIQLPERAVTRFFVPLIDVLILLFCIFLLLPFVATPADQTAGSDTPTDLESLRSEVRKAKDELAIERKRVDELLRERAESAQRTLVRVIDIDGDTGEMSYAASDGPPGRRYPLASAEDARNLILNAKKKSDGRAVKFLFVCPRKPSRFPDRKTLDDIGAWFASESVTIDNPFAPR
ncbi:MAG: hypothetical protein MUF18_10235 [Fimbriiglobus sp.]|nr:hypothetical protein [Fimbriiglobus sp.]